MHFFFAAEGLHCIQHGLITGAEGLGVGGGRRTEEHPTKTLCLTSLNNSNATLSFTTLN